MTNLGGIYPPIVIPFDSQEKVALDKLESNLDKWLAQPLDGIVVPGSNSEATFLTQEERIQIWKTCANRMRGTGKRLIAGTGVETTAETIELTLRAAELGAEAALLLPPYFYKASMTHEVLLTHFRAVADASPIPLLVYNVPQFTGIDFALGMLVAMAEHTRIVGVKDSSSNVVKMASLRAARPNFQVFAGTASALLPFLSIGAAGGVMALANFAAVPLHQLLDAFMAGRNDEARRIQISVADINLAVTARFGVPALKYAMDRTGFYGGPTRRPLLSLKPQEQAELDRLLAPLHLG